MAAYGALVSLMHIIDQIQHHPRPPISLDKEQVESLTEMICFLQDFLEAYDSHGGSEEAGGLQSRIADAAYAIEDIIESHIVDQILAQSSCSVDFYQRLQKVIQDMDFTKKEAMEIRDKMGVQNHPHKSFTPPVSSRSSTGQNNMVGFDDVLYEIMDKLTGSQQSSQRIIPIVGMGGIGKTTLARNVYVNELIVQHFDIRGWVTISQEYNMRKVLLEVLHQKNQGSKESLSQMSEEELGEKLYKSLFGRRYLVIMDDMWSVEVWNKIKLYFPSNNNGSWIIITTRLSNMALDLVGTDVVQMSFLDEDKSWNLLCTTVFGGEDCPFELEQVGRKIAKNCKGLPLSIVVIGGLLAKSNWVLEYWKHVAENLNSIVKLEENETCLKILHTSYNLLPIHLKPCFLYMGIFPEDAEIRVSKVIKLWVAEGFLKPISGKNLEVVAKEYLKDLIDRNLILVRKWGLSSGNIKSCNIHDLLRELCLREVEKDKFFCTKSQGNLTFPKDINAQRRIAIYERTLINDEENFTKVHQASQFTSLSRSLICHFSEASTSLDFRLLRVMKVVGDDRPKEEYNLDDIFKLVNLRHIAITTMWSLVSNKISSLSSWCLLWSLQTLIVKGRFDHRHIAAPPEIWEMTQLRHVHFEGLYLPHPPSSNMVKQNEFVWLRGFPMSSN